MSIKTLKDLIIAMNKCEVFDFAHHQVDGKFSLESTLAKLNIVETQHFPILPNQSVIEGNLHFAVQERHGSNIIDLAKELIYRHHIPEETIVGMMVTACNKNGVKLEPRTPFLKGTPSLPRGCTGTGSSRSVEDIKRHYASFRSQKNKPETRIARKRAILGLLRATQFRQEELLSIILAPGTVETLGRSKTGWADFEDFLKTMQDEITSKQNYIKQSTKEMADAMKEMHNKSNIRQQDKPIHFLGRDHYQAMVFAPTHSSDEAIIYVDKMMAADHKEVDRKRAFQAVMSYIHRLSTEHQTAIIGHLGITETDPRQVGIQITKLLEEKIMKTPVAVPPVVIEFDKKYDGYPFSKTNAALTNPKLAVDQFFNIFQTDLFNQVAVTNAIKMICAFFTLANDEVKHDVLTQVYRIYYMAATPKELGQAIVEMSTRWLEHRLALTLAATRQQNTNRNTFDPQNLEGNKMTKPTATIIDGDYPDMAAELQRMFQNNGMNVHRPAMAEHPLSPTNMLAGAKPVSELDKNIETLVDSWLAVKGIKQNSANYATIRAEHLQKAFDQYKPKLKTETIEQNVITGFKILNAHRGVECVISMCYSVNCQIAVITVQSPNSNAGIKLGHFKLNKEGADQVLAHVRECCENNVRGLEPIIQRKVVELCGVLIP